MEICNNKLIQAQERLLSFNRQRYVAFASKLDALSPLKVLTRGYSVVNDPAGKLIKSVHQVGIGDRISVSMADGSLQASVMDIKEDI